MLQEDYLDNLIKYFIRLDNNLSILDQKLSDSTLIKRGQWILQDGYDKRDNWYVCSECGRSINLIGGDRLENYPYCHCGAKMDSEAMNEVN